MPDLSRSTPAISLVPKSFTIGLGAFAFLLGIAGFVVKILLFGESFNQILPSFMRVVAIFWLLIPCGFILGAKIINRFLPMQEQKQPIQPRNALTLGLLFSCVAMLWLMAGNS
ncbi:hypothetical protein MOMA_04700 [Moraxella macacae 0408225]|uniref:Uncharacterized protein n=1 Tax=Moraxella macacae 0408225 TaxID=1230338 RepID=L2FAA2_9GAMM|nr:hypothetical protein [Moraxella macacae]ELA09676.1 hypothetical protein MOMA_04700 [Moraxella macacae 0408225]